MNFKQFLVAIALTIVSFSALAQHNPNPVFGDWYAINRLADYNTEYQVEFRFTPHQVNLHVTCFFRDGAILSARVSAAAAYQYSYAYDIFIQQAQQAVISDGARFCRATLQPTVWTAYFDGFGRMQLMTQVPFNSQFILVRR